MAGNQQQDITTEEAILVTLKRLEGKVDSLREYVERIEKEAHEAMGGLTDPDNMMKMAGQMFGLK